jgi:hypothetical protein
MTARSDRKALQLLYLASSLAGGLSLLIPVVALALVLAYGFGHVHGTPRLFLGFMAVTALAGTLPRAIRIGQTLRVGKLRVSGAIVQRLEAPRRFWTWVAVEAFFFLLNIATAIFLAWVTFQWRA